MKTATTRKSRSKTTSRDETEFSFSSGPFYAEKDEYLAKGLIFTINAIEFQEKAGIDNSDRWAVLVSVGDGRPDELITLPSNDKRDAELVAAAAHIEDRGPIRNCKLVKSGKAYYFRNAAETKSS
ncbi:MAG: hypothetical protein WAL67_06815 [Candidatus Cybelea sp.]